MNVFFYPKQDRWMSYGISRSSNRVGVMNLKVAILCQSEMASSERF